MEKYFVSQKQD